MAWYAFARDERFVGLGLMAACVAGAFLGVRAALRPYRLTSELQAAQPKTQYITQETEDSLPLETLNSLLDHYNFSIRETAAKIVCDRAINDDATLGRLLWGIARPGYDERMKSLRALAMLTDQNTLHRLNTAEAFGAFVRSLEHCVVDADDDSQDGYDMVDDVYFDEYYLRDIAEKLCLMFLAQLTAKFGVDALVRAEFVERWLARQRWGAPRGGAGRMRNFTRYLQCRDNRISDICRRLRDAPAGRAALERAQLVAPRPQQQQQSQKLLELEQQQQQQNQQQQQQHAPHASSPLRLELRVVNGTIVSGELIEGDDAEAVVRSARAVLGVLDSVEDMVEGMQESGEPGEPGEAAASADAASARQPRPPSQNTREEQRIRRQHREAMVLNDGTRPLRRDDIIQRESD